MNTDKSTDELYKILQNKKNYIEDYLEENSAELIDVTLSEYLEIMLKKYNLIKSDVIKNSKLNQIYAYQIFSGKKINPSRDKIIQLIFGMNLNLEDTQRTMKIAGVNPLYPRNKRDSIIIFALKKNYNIEKCDEMLFELNENTIISEN